MSKYKVGDKFIIEVKEVLNDELPYDTENLYRIDGFKTLVFDAYGLDKLQKYEDEVIATKFYEKGRQEALQEVRNCESYGYEQGLQDAWELALKVAASEKYEGIPYDDCMKIFETICGAEIIRNNTPQQALAKIEAYEESKVIKVGDVIRFKDSKTEVLITSVKEELNGIHIQTDEYGKIGDLHSCICRKDVEKTGKHLDIEHLLEQIRGDE